MPPQIESLLILYIGAVFFNTVLSAALWYDRRDPLTRTQFLVWLFTLLGFIFQGAPPFQHGHYAITLGYSSIYALSLAIMSLTGQIVKISFPWKLFHLVFVAGLAVGGAMEALHQPFIFVAMPVAFGVAFPSLFASLKALFTSWREMTFSAKAFVLSVFLYSIHMLDFALLRDKPQALATAFTVGILVIFMISVFAPAVIIEVLTQTQARVAAEMDVARRIQMEILPRNPEIKGLELACYMKPADEVGGDYYDIFTVGDRAWILLGDVTGHGLSSGLVMLMAQSIISSILHTQKDISPGALNTIANEILYDNLQRLNEDRQMTIVSICLEAGNNNWPRKAVYSGCHDNLFIYRAATKEVETVEISQFPCGLGFFRDVEENMVSNANMVLNSEDVLVIITDGVTEAAKEGKHERGFFNEERVREIVKTNANEPVETIREKLTQQLQDFTAGVYHDDVTFLIARVKEPA